MTILTKRNSVKSSLKLAAPAILAGLAMFGIGKAAHADTTPVTNGTQSTANSSIQNTNIKNTSSSNPDVVTHWNGNVKPDLGVQYQSTLRNVGHVKLVDNRSPQTMNGRIGLNNQDKNSTQQDFQAYLKNVVNKARNQPAQIEVAPSTQFGGTEGQTGSGFNWPSSMGFTNLGGYFNPGGDVHQDIRSMKSYSQPSDHKIIAFCESPSKPTPHGVLPSGNNGSEAKAFKVLVAGYPYSGQETGEAATQDAIWNVVDGTSVPGGKVGDMAKQILKKAKNAPQKPNGVDWFTVHTYKGTGHGWQNVIAVAFGKNTSPKTPGHPGSSGSGGSSSSSSSAGGGGAGGSAAGGGAGGGTGVGGTTGGQNGTVGGQGGSGSGNNNSTPSGANNNDVIPSSGSGGGSSSNNNPANNNVVPESPIINNNDHDNGSNGNNNNNNDDADIAALAIAEHNREQNDFTDTVATLKDNDGNAALSRNQDADQYNEDVDGADAATHARLVGQLGVVNQNAANQLQQEQAKYDAKLQALRARAGFDRQKTDLIDHANDQPNAAQSALGAAILANFENQLNSCGC